MPGPLVAAVAGGIGSAAIQANAAKKAAKAQAGAADQQIEETRRQFDLIQRLLKPYVNAGTAGLQARLDLMGLGGNSDQGITAQQAQQTAIDQLAGGEQFGQLVKQGEYAIMANGAATGGLRGGDTQAAMAQFRPQMLQALIDKQLANFGEIAANGQNAAAMTGTAAQNAGAQVNAALGDKGAAYAGSALATGQAWQNAGSGVLNTLGMMAQPLTPGGGAWQKWTF